MEILHRLESGMKHILYKGVEISPYQTRFKNLEGKSKREVYMDEVYKSRSTWLCHMLICCHSHAHLTMLPFFPMMFRAFVSLNY